MAENRVYCNSYMQKKDGSDDTEFVLDLGAPYTFNRIQLDSAIIENQFPTFYDSYNSDFTRMTVEYDNGLGVAVSETVILDQFYSSFDEVVSYFNKTNTKGLTMVSLP